MAPQRLILQQLMITYTFGNTVDTQGEGGPAPSYKRSGNYWGEERRARSRDDPFVLSTKGRRVLDADRQFERAVLRELAKNEEEMTIQEYVTNSAHLNPVEHLDTWILTRKHKGIITREDEDRLLAEYSRCILRQTLYLKGGIFSKPEWRHYEQELMVSHTEHLMDPET